MMLDDHRRLINITVGTSFLLLVLLYPFFSLAEQPEWQGKVIAIKDGDTIVVLSPKNLPVTIRLSGIDAPEKGQEFGQAAKHLASDLCFGKTVTVKESGIDKYGRTLAQIILSDGRNVEEKLVRLGFAWHYKKYSSDIRLATLEQEARESQRGLWATLNPVPPWDWRSGKHNESVNKPASPLEVQNIGIIHGNIKSHIFHRQSCRYYDCSNCTAVFSTRDEAIKAGFRPCKICNP